MKDIFWAVVGTFAAIFIFTVAITTTIIWMDDIKSFIHPHNNEQKPKIHDNEYYYEEPIKAYRVNAGDHLITNMKISGVFEGDFDIVAVQDVWVETFEDYINYYPLYKCINNEQWLPTIGSDIPNFYTYMNDMFIVINDKRNTNIMFDFTNADMRLIWTHTKEKRYCKGLESIPITEDNYLTNH